jgi:hypothetical protein
MGTYHELILRFTPESASLREPADAELNADPSVPRPVIHLFPKLEYSNFNGLSLIFFTLARGRERQGVFRQAGIALMVYRKASGNAADLA